MMGKTIPKKEWLSVPGMLSLCYMKVSSRMPRGFAGIKCWFIQGFWS